MELFLQIIGNYYTVDSNITFVCAENDDKEMDGVCESVGLFVLKGDHTVCV